MLPVNSNDIDNILLARRNKARAEAQQRAEKLYKEIPELQSLDEELRSLRIEKFRNMRLRNDHLTAQTEEKLRRVKESISAMLTSAGYQNDYLEIKYECPKCSDTGYINTKRCECADMLVYDLMYRNASLEGAVNQSFESFDLSVFEGDDETSIKQYNTMKKVYKYCETYADNFTVGKSKNLIFAGPTGTGKTFLSNCVAGRVLKKRHSVIAVSAYSLVEVLRNAAFNGSAELKRFNEAELLVIDELGMEQMLNNVTVEMLFMVINERYRKGYPVIVNTNLTTQQMTDRYTERITSRLFDKEKSVVFGFEGHDVRLKPARKR